METKPDVEKIRLRSAITYFLESAGHFVYNAFLITVLVGIVVGLFVAGIGNKQIYKYGYKNGQVDAINSIIKFELVVQPNNEKKWVEKEE